ncbi:MAG: PorT family protein [Flavobacteriales bacterium]|jgi:hypothetical protein|nr:PorT family protein [Flavobacteriales bacterium]
MKKLLLFLTLLVASQTTFAQSTNEIKKDLEKKIIHRVQKYLIKSPRLVKAVMDKESKLLERKILKIQKQFEAGTITKVESEKRKNKAINKSANKVSLMLEAMATPGKTAEWNIEHDTIANNGVLIHENHWASNLKVPIGFGWNNWITNGNHSNIFDAGKSMYFKIGLAYPMYFKNEKTSIDLGLVYNTTNYRIDNDNYRMAHDPIYGVRFTKIKSDQKATLSRFNQSTLDIPLTISHKFNDKHKFIVSAGVYGGLVLRSKQVVRYNDGNKDKWKSNWSTNSFYGGLIFKAGVKGVYLETKFRLNEVFSKSESGLRNQYPFQIGLSFGDF